MRRACRDAEAPACVSWCTACYDVAVGAILLSYLGLILILVAAVVGPLMAGRMLAERELEPDAETLAIEARALALLAGRVELEDELA